MSVAFETGLYSKLSGGTALTAALGGTAIYNTQAPEGTSYPFVVFFHSGGGDDNTSPHRARSVVYTVQAIAQHGGTAEALSDLVDALLHNGSLSVSGYHNYYSAREMDVAYTVFSPGGELIWHRGAQYRFRIATS